VVISRKPRQWYWVSGYPGRVYPFSLDESELLEEARAIGARYVVLDQLGGTADAYLLPALRLNRQRFCVVRRVVREGETAALLGILPEPWDPVVHGLEDTLEDPAVSELRLPLCSTAFRVGE
ncbi:MAG: hypothetical protein ACOCUW_05635, partial [Gemmatimonadota bacterium]